MQNKNKKDLSDFAKAALELDADFEELEKLGGQLERAEIDSDAGLERGRELLNKFGECGSRIGAEIQAMAGALDESRKRAEKASEVVAARAVQIQERLQTTNRIRERFNQLAEMVNTVSKGIAHFKKPQGQPMTSEEKKFLGAKIPELDEQLSGLAGQALIIRKDARAENMKLLEKNADSLSQTLESARKKLGKLGLND